MKSHSFTKLRHSHGDWARNAIYISLALSLAADDCDLSRHKISCRSSEFFAWRKFCMYDIAHSHDTEIAFGVFLSEFFYCCHKMRTFTVASAIFYINLIFHADQFCAKIENWIQQYGKYVKSVKFRLWIATNSLASFNYSSVPRLISALNFIHLGTSVKN